MFVEALEEILRDCCTGSVVRAIEAGADHTPLWRAIADAGFLELMSAEEAGGADLPLAELFPVVMLLGSYSVPLPVAQSMVARVLLPNAPPGLLTLAPSVRHTASGWSCPHVPYGTIADHVLADDGTGLLLFNVGPEHRSPADSHRSQTASLCFPQGARVQRYAAAEHAHASFAAALHAALMAGAMNRAFEMTLGYGNDRVQFGKAIGKYQAVQHQLAVMAEQVASVRIAAQAAFVAEGRTPARLVAAVAKARASEAVSTVAAIAHAVHGAIGVTAEYDLQLVTRRLHEWRMAHGSEVYWHRLVGKAFAEAESPIVDYIRSI